MDSDFSTETDTGIQVTAYEALPHPRPYCGPQVWRSFGSDLGSRVFEAPFVSLLASGAEVVSLSLLGLFLFSTLFPEVDQLHKGEIMALHGCF